MGFEAFPVLELDTSNERDSQVENHLLKKEFLSKRGEFKPFSLLDEDSKFETGA